MGRIRERKTVRSFVLCCFSLNQKSQSSLFITPTPPTTTIVIIRQISPHISLKEVFFAIGKILERESASTSTNRVVKTSRERTSQISSSCSLAFVDSDSQIPVPETLVFVKCSDYEVCGQLICSNDSCFVEFDPPNPRFCYGGVVRGGEDAADAAAGRGRVPSQEEDEDCFSVGDSRENFCWFVFFFFFFFRFLFCWFYSFSRYFCQYCVGLAEN